jgi:hypothetical protein
LVIGLAVFFRLLIWTWRRFFGVTLTARESAAVGGAVVGLIAATPLKESIVRGAAFGTTIILGYLVVKLLTKVASGKSAG